MSDGQNAMMAKTKVIGKIIGRTYDLPLNKDGEFGVLLKKFDEAEVKRK